ncbi:aminoglycoside phosphotransferase [Streptomyces monashensis]|uniref:Aminoglycoside phosphotransferase n=1 Tax=Streptomyces monashensis TaxID=1678012 RepID=A0A1S2Q0G3_9ACTN|nr:aminoglycoside phosphotransferase [Streptomyces monashensis]
MTHDQLTRAARAAVGGGRWLEAVERLAGGTTKGVYRLTMDDATTAIAYVWEESEHYWPATESDGDLADPFSPGVGLDLFAASHARLSTLGLRVPGIYLVDRDRTHYPADLAIVEDFRGGNLMDLFNRDPRAAAPTMSRLADALAVMRGHRATSFGKVAHIDAGGTSRAASCQEAALDFALRCLAEAASRDRRIADAQGRLEARLRGLAAMVRPRAEYSLVHGELGLDHVLVDSGGNPVVIDIEEMLYFDVEWEHVFLQLRHSDSQYRPLAVESLDADRLALYKLTQHLSLTAGPLRLLDGDFPDRAFMQGIAEHHLNEALALVSAA